MRADNRVQTRNKQEIKLLNNTEVVDTDARNDIRYKTKTAAQRYAELQLQKPPTTMMIIIETVNRPPASLYHLSRTTWYCLYCIDAMKIKILSPKFYIFLTRKRLANFT